MLTYISSNICFYKMFPFSMQSYWRARAHGTIRAWHLDRCVWYAHIAAYMRVYTREIWVHEV